MAAAAASGIALALALPGPGLVLLVLLVPGLLLEALRPLSRARSAAAIGWLGGTVHWLVAACWVTDVMHSYGGLPMAAAIACLIAMAIYLGASWVAVALLTHPAPPALRPWALVAAFSTVEALRQLPPYAFPWNPVASALADIPQLLGSLPIWGATGLGWAVLALGAGLWSLLRTETRRSGLALIATALVLTGITTAIAPPAPTGGEPLKVALIQPATLLEERWDPSQWSEVMDRVRRQTLEAAGQHPDLVLWPEGAVPFRIDTDPEYRRWLLDLAGAVDAPILVNSVASAPGASHTNSVFVVPPPVSVGTGAPRPWQTWQRYDKVRLVPYGEYVPAIARLAFTESLVREVGAFVPGDGRTILEVDGHRLGMAICYEIVFADLVAHQQHLGAELLTTVTNDGWYGESWAPHQHLAQAVLRAVEGRRWLARAALTGISAIVDPSGRIVHRIPLGKPGLVVADVRLLTDLTPRVRLGDWWGLLCGLGTLGLLMVPRVTRVLAAMRRRRQGS
jgi:apolipoprotein N-acyltransferase